MIDRKTASREYKNTIQPMGIFQVKNLSNTKIYLAKSKNLPGSINSTRFQLNLGSFPNQILQQEYRQFGPEQFSFEIIDQLKPKEDPSYNYSDDLEILENLWLEKMQPYGEKGYNKPKQ